MSTLVTEPVVCPLCGQAHELQRCPLYPNFYRFVMLALRLTDWGQAQEARHAG